MTPPSTYTMQPAGPIQGTVRPPGSKSITNRALVCAALARGVSQLNGVLDSEDTEVMIKGLRRLGFEIQHSAHDAVASVQGTGGNVPVHAAELFVNNSGTTMRFLTPLVALGQGDFRLDGVARMRERPMFDLIEALRPLGVMVESVAHSGCPPLTVHARGLNGGATTVRGNVSSQFLSGLLMVAPYAKHDVEIEVHGPLVSQPYVEMTRRVMQAFGVEIQQPEVGRYRVAAGSSYVGCEYAIEPDASAASYFWGAAAVTGGTVQVQGLGRDSLQGDVRFCECLREMGCEVDYSVDSVTVRGGSLRGISVDMNAISDTVQTLAAVSLFAAGTTRITGVGHIRHKETDRIGDLARELRKLGAHVEEFEDGLAITPGTLRGAKIATYQDHRMAMSLALVGLRIPGVMIEDPGCTAKTYPNFFADLRSLSEAAAKH